MRLGTFLSAAASSNAQQALQSFGFLDLAGRGAEDVLAAVLDALAPEGATLEEAAARRAMADTLAALYEEYGVLDGGLERLSAMSGDKFDALLSWSTRWDSNSLNFISA